MNLIIFVSSLMMGFGAAELQNHDVILYVDQTHPASADENPGTIDQPFRSIQMGVVHALRHKRAMRSVKVVIAPGTYRETINLETYTNWESNQPNNKTPMLFEAASPGTVIISGSEVLRGWQKEPTSGMYAHEWRYVWGAYKNPWEGHVEMKEIVRRREMVFVNGKRLTQVLNRSDVKAGTFMVDEDEALIWMLPPKGVDMASATIEAAQREKLWWQEYEHNITIRGIVFQHAATRWDNAWAAIRISGSNGVYFDACEIRQNNGLGLYMGELADITLRRVRMNHNGWDGWGTWRVEGMTAMDTETSYNNWRGTMGGFHGWAVGNKLESTHGIKIKRHKAIGNFSRGLWLDVDMRDIHLEDVLIKDNLSDGIWFEASPGPILLKNSRICTNGENGLLTTYAQNVTLDGNVFYGNKKHQLSLAGQGDRIIRNFKSDAHESLVLKDWTLRGNAFIGGEMLIGARYQFGQEEWSRFKTSLTSEGNTFYHPDQSRVFRVVDEEGNRLSFSQWQRASGKDLDSRFANPMQSNPCNQNSR